MASSPREKRKMSKEILDALADALMGTGSTHTPEASQKWYVCVSDGQGGVKSHEMKSLRQAELTVRDWQLAGWPAWLQDEDGTPVVIAKRAEGKN
jgi:anti-sigma factor ChrR (cupin superfamily)